MLKVIAACGNGMGSSQMIKMKISKVFKKLGGTCSKYLDESGLNTCKMEWREDFIKVWYNSYLVMDMRDRDYLEYFNNSNGMEIHLNNYVQGDKTDDCSEPMRPFVITDLKYEK